MGEPGFIGSIDRSNPVNSELHRTVEFLAVADSVLQVDMVQRDVFSSRLCVGLEDVATFLRDNFPALGIEDQAGIPLVTPSTGGYSSSTSMLSGNSRPSSQK